MIETESRVRSSCNPLASVLDARRRNTIMADGYTLMERNRADRIHMVLDTVYTHDGIYVNYRQRFIAIKVSNPLVVDAVNLDHFEQDWQSQGIVRKVTAQGIIYTIPRVKL